ncbi:MAG: coenzyme F420-0:L-glutamate ligase [Caldilineaceae bacterium]
MNIYTLKTHKIITTNKDLFAILDTYLPSFTEGSILAITSKIIAISEGNVVKIGAVDKQGLIEQEADYFLPPDTNRYGVTLTIKHNLLIPNAGIDESNGNGYHILWPRQPQQTANALRAYLCHRFNIQQAGVIITDSNVTPLRMGVTGVALAHSGFLALNNYVGVSDLFDRPLRMTQANLADALATTAVLLMGEGNEQTPLAVIQDAPFVTFQMRDPTADELDQLQIAREDDLYGALLTNAAWHKGGVVETRM